MKRTNLSKDLEDQYTKSYRTLLRGIKEKGGGASQVHRGKEPACPCTRHGRCGLDPWVGKIPWRRAWNPLQYSCLENPLDRGACWAIVHGVTKSWTRLK